MSPPELNLPVLIPIVAACITVFGLVLIGACLGCVDLRPRRHVVRGFR